MTLPLRRCGQYHSALSCLACALTDEVESLRRAQQPDDALRVAAREVKNGLEMMLAASMLGERSYDAMEWRRAASDSFELLRDALDGAPYEPSEEMVERAAEAIWDMHYGANPVTETDPEWTGADVVSYARAALRAAFGVDSGSAG